MDKIYRHELVEAQIYHLWEQSKVFAPKTDKSAKPFCIIMPPPNANDPLHLGHAMFVTIEDILIRYHRMLGDSTLWLPGTDHAGIETQYVFEKKLKKEGKSRFHFDRETLYKMIWDYVQENSGIAISQMKRLGASADWSRTKFTLDKDCVDLTLKTFKKMHNEGLIYRDMGLINFCPKCGTGYSDLEIVREDRQNPLCYIKYGKFTIATARPETKFRDTALAVNPKDKRYRHEIGKTYKILGLLGYIKMTVIADDGVDPDFGTGIMKVTPAHDPHDFELGKRYNLPVTPIIDFQGKMDFSWFIDAADESTNLKYLQRAKKYHDKKVLEARKLMVEDLKADGLLIKIDEKHKNSIALCYRCKSILEPLPLAQFFVKVKPLTQKTLASLDNKKTVVFGAGHDKILRHWLKNLKDWNISRQIVWGIRVPVWYEVKIKNQKSKIKNSEQNFKNASYNIIVGFLDENKNYVSGKIGELLKTHDFKLIKNNLQTLTAPVSAEYIVSSTSPGDNYLQETDTFDTWFSSSQWPVTTLKTTNPNDFKRFYPTQVMETAYDILIFWVMRMLMMGIYFTGKVPFKKVYLHGLVRDEKGQKMSKSKGNVINPLAVIEKYGADALRMALVMSTTAGRDSSTGENKIRGMRNLTNKIWNAARFIVMNREITNHKSQITNKSKIQNQKKQNSEKEFYKKLSQINKTVTKQLNDLKVGLAAETVYNEFWHWFCDKCIEKTKNGKISQTSLTYGLVTFLKLLHPFVPFVTEAIYQELIKAKVTTSKEDLLINSQWPNTLLKS